MERTLKERIIGAVVLVAVVVLVVPVFLDGPPGDNKVISEHVRLPGQSEQKSQTVVLARDRDEPVPAQASTESPQQSESTPQKNVPTPQSPPVVKRAEVVVDVAPEIDARMPKPEPVEPTSKADDETKLVEPKQSTASSTGMWAVQLGSFSSQKNAEKLATDLRKQGFAAFLSKLSGSTGVLHRVRIGPQKDRQAAEKMASRLKKSGHSGQVVPHP